MTQISRDPFARTELHRRTLQTGQGCAWCGQSGHNRNGLCLYIYRTESDGGRMSEHKGLFCSKSCHDAYHGG